MLLFVLSCVQCCQYILGCYASLRSVLCPMLPVYLGFTTGLELWCWVLFISSYYSVLCPMLPVYLGLLCFSSFCLVSNVASISWAHNRFRVVVLGVVHFVLLFCLMSNVASISWVVMLLFVLSCVQCCQYILGCYASLRSVLCPMLPVYLGLTTSLELWCWVLFISSYYSVLCPMLPVYLGLLCFSSFCLVSNVASISWVVMLFFVLSCVQCCQYILGSQPFRVVVFVVFISSYYSVLCPMLPVYLGLLCFSSFCLVSNVASISWVVMLLFVLSCVQCCQYILGCYASFRSVLCPMLPVYLGLTTSLELWCSCCLFRLIISIVVLSSVL